MQIYTKFQRPGASEVDRMEVDRTSGRDHGPLGSGIPSDGRGTATGVRVLIANEPSIYREVISSALEELRPGVEVFTAEADDLEKEFLRLLPDLVVCSHTTKRVETDAPAWVELYPDGASHAVVRDLEGSRRTFYRIDFDNLLLILDKM